MNTVKALEVSATIASLEKGIGKLRHQLNGLASETQDRMIDNAEQALLVLKHSLRPVEPRKDD